MVGTYCKFCPLSLESVHGLLSHVVGHKHRALMSQVSPDTWEQLGRLQYFVDTYLETVPVLGLEYVEEKQVGASYRYNCTLCNTELDWQKMVLHATHPIHTRDYIVRHHGDLIDASIPTKGPVSRKQRQNLHMLTETIHAKHGRKQICIKESNVSELPATVSSAHEEHNKSTTTPCVVHHCSLCSVSSSSFQELNEHVMSAQHRRHVRERLKNPKSWSEALYCSLCNITGSSFVMLSEHVMGVQHKIKLERSSSPSAVCDVGRLGHFMDTYMQQEPILGLEYIVEMKMNSLYNYTCTLCNMNGNLRQIVSHLLDVDHPYRYIETHHFGMLHFVTHKNLLLKVVAKKILDSELFKENAAPVADDSKRREDSAGERGVMLPSRQEGGGERGDILPSRQEGGGERGDILPSRQEGGSERDDILPSRQEGGSERDDILPSRQEGGGERDDILPSRQEGGGERGDILPSRQEGGMSFHFRRGPLPYLEEAYTSHSYKITLTTPVIDDPPLPKRQRLFPKEDFAALPSTPHTSTDPHYDERHAMEQVPSAMQELQFHNNHQFFEYLSNFKIKDSHDVILIQKIIQNCIRALNRFREELQMQIPALEPEASSAYTIRIDQEILNTSFKPESPPLA